MVQQWRQRIWYIATGAAFTGAILFSALPSAAQLLQDSSLGAESSVIIPVVDSTGQPANLIGGGARRGENLFHSFQEFNVSNLQQVFFTNPAGVENILSRVTGTNPSNILGTLGVLGEANLFLLNPNGIIFGPGATLNINGSFVASTANSVRFANGIEFSAVDPAAPPLLTIHTPIGLQYGSNSSALQVRGATLAVPSGQTLALVGGNVRINEAQLLAPGGRIELAGVAANGTVDLIANRSPLFLSLPAATPRANVAVTGGSEINVLAGGGGDIAINARNLNISGGNRIRAGINLGLGSVGSRAGNIEIYTTEATNIDASLISNNLLAEVGNAGNISIITELLTVTGRTQLVSSTNGQGDTGSVSIDANESVFFRDSAIFTSVERTGTGDAGSINITSESLSLEDQSQLVSRTLGRGNAGSINLDVLDIVTFDNFSSVRNTVEPMGIGNAGDINITSRSVALTGVSQLVSGTAGQGNAGRINIRARDTVTFTGSRRVSGNDFASGAFTNVALGGMGDGGEINITTRSLRVAEGARLGASTGGEGRAGNITINARDTVIFDGVGITGLSSVAGSQVRERGTGDGGDINITTGVLRVTGGAQLVAITLGEGRAGNVTINARDTVAFNGVGTNGQPSAAASGVERGGIGNGGNVSITARSLFVTEGARLDASTRGLGTAGNIFINSSDTVVFDGVGINGLFSGAYSTVDLTGVGDGGDIHLASNLLLLTNGAGLIVSSSGAGSAGSLIVNASEIRLDHEGIINADTISGGGDIDLRSPLLILHNNSRITTNAQGTATGGNIDIDTGSGFIVSPFNENNDIIANAVEGSGGQITLSAQGIFGFEIRTREDLQRLLNPPNPLDPQRLQTNDITAFSQANPMIDTGAVTVRTPDLDPARGLTALPSDLTDSSQLIATTCPADQGSSFAVTGRGGLPEDPRQPLTGQVVWEDERGEGREGEVGGVEEVGEVAIAEAQGWVVDRTGRVVLVAQQSQASSLALPEYWSCTSSSQE